MDGYIPTHTRIYRKMGLSVHIEDDEGGGAHDLAFDLSYPAFLRYRGYVAGAVRGKLHRQYYLDKIMFDMMPFRGERTPQMLKLLGVKIPVPPRGVLKHSEINIILEHSDCDGEFTHEEAKKLFPILRVNRSNFKKLTSDIDEKGIYDKFLRVFLYCSKHPGSKIVFS